MSSENLKHGDKVTWKSQGKKIAGTVEKKLTKPTKIKGHQVQATTENPEYLVKSDQTGAEAAHHASALDKTSSKS